MARNYFVVKTTAGVADEIRSFETKDAAEKGLKDAVRDFFSDLGVEIDMPEKHLSACNAALVKAVGSDKVPDVSMYGTYPFIETIEPDLFTVFYQTEDDWGYSCIGDIPLLSWAVIAC